MTEPVKVDVGACRCPGTPHPSDYVYLRPVLDVSMGMAAMAAIDAADDAAEIQGALSLIYLRNGIIGWSLVDADGAPIPVTKAKIAEAITWTAGGYDVAKEADRLYSADLFAPLAVRRQEAIAAWADGRLDVSEPILWRLVPDVLAAILAQRVGWEAVRGPGVLTFREAQLMLQLEAEERVGRPQRERAYAAKAREEAAAAAVRAAVHGAR